MALTLKNLGEFLKRYPIGVVCGALSAGALVGYLVRTSRASELGDHLKQVEAQTKEILGEVRNGTNLVEQYATLTAATKGLESRLMQATERARNQQYFYQVESETGVKEVSLQPANADPKKDPGRLYQRIRFTITVEGDYRQVLDFVGRLESGQHFYRLISASVVRREDRSAPGSGSLVDLTLSLELLGLP